MLNCFKYFLIYIFGKNVSKIRQERLSKELYQVFVYNFLGQNVPILPYCILLMQYMHFSVKIGSISFSSSGIQKFHCFLGCHAIGINSPLIFFCSLRFLNLFCQAKRLMKITVLGSSLSNLHQKRGNHRLRTKQYKAFYNRFICNKPIGNKFQYCQTIINSFITYVLSFMFIRTIYY